jgi:DNA transposition AAA+ family ATPase
MKTYFPKLRSAQVVEKALDRICANDIIGVIVGAPGCGRTMALSHWRKRPTTPEHIWIEVGLCGTLSATVTALAEGLGITRTSIDNTSLKIAQKLAENRRPVIFDDAGWLPFTAFNKLRAIWDRVQALRDEEDGRGFAMAWIGAHDLRTKLTKDEEQCEQILRRVGEFDEVPALNLGELLGVLSAKWKLEPPLLAQGAAEELLRLSRGSMGWLDKIIPTALDLAAKDGKVINPKIVRATSRYLVGVEEQ